MKFKKLTTLAALATIGLQSTTTLTAFAAENEAPKQPTTENVAQTQTEADRIAKENEAKIEASEKVEKAQQEAADAVANKDNTQQSNPGENASDKNENGGTQDGSSEGSGTEQKPEVKPEQKPEQPSKPETSKPEGENKPETKPEEGQKPEVKPEEGQKPEVKPEQKPQQPSKPESSKPNHTGSQGQQTVLKPTRPAKDYNVTQTPKPIAETKEGEAYIVPANEAPSSGAGYLGGAKFSKVVYSEDLKTEAFIETIGEQAKFIANKNNLYASVMIAQAILESGSGSSLLSKAPNNNLFGIKGSYKGQSVNFDTLEDAGNGSMYSINDGFRKYSTVSESLQDYADLLTVDMASYYSGVTRDHAKTAQDAATFLQGRYATDTNYAAKLNGLIETYDLTRFDEEQEFEVLGLIDYEAPKTKEVDGKEKAVDMNEAYANLEAFSTSLLGRSYVWGGNFNEEGTQDGDCSSLTQYAYRQAFGVEIPRTTYGQEKLGESVDMDKLQMGDLLFWNENGDTHHVAMYLGNGYYIHAPNPNEKVKINSIDEWAPTFAKRLIKTEKRDMSDKAKEERKAKTAELRAQELAEKDK